MPARQRRRRARGLLTVLCTALALLGCGGGGGVDVGGTGTSQPGYAQGSISGFGSIVVNGVHYDESAATVRDEDGNLIDAADLALGMTVSIEASDIDRTALTGVADTITVAGELVGRVDAVDAAAGTLTVFGQPVRSGSVTVFDERLTGGLAAVSVGDEVRVYALLDDAGGDYRARRIEPVTSTDHYLVRGTVTALDTTARTFDIGTQNFVYDAGTAPAGLANGATVRITTSTSKDAQGRWTVRGASVDNPSLEDGDEVEIEAIVTSVPQSGHLVVGGYTVDARSAEIEPAGTVVQVGDAVEVEGAVVDGVVIAHSVKLREREGDDGEEGSSFELEGGITSVDTTARSFVVRGVTVMWDDTVTFRGGAAADLVVGVKVDVEGALAADGVTLQAAKIEFED